MSSTSATLMYAELLSNIRQVSIIASFRTPSTAATKAELSDDCRLLKLIHDSDEGLLRLPAQVVATSKLQQPLLGSKEICWRLPLASQDTATKAPDSADTASAPWSAQRLSEQSELYCRNCGNNLVAPSAIKLWRDLPSENWAEMMDFWHCHKPDVPQNQKAKNSQLHEHLKDKGYGANTRFIARRGVGFVDLTYFLLSKEDCKGVKVRETHVSLNYYTGYQEGGLTSTCSSWFGHRYKYPKLILYTISLLRLVTLFSDYGLLDLVEAHDLGISSVPS